jgi:hypothetical protein
MGLLIGYNLRGCVAEQPTAPEPIVIHDTIKQTDTLRLREKTKTIEVIRYDTIWIEREDSADNAHTTNDSNHCVDTTEMGTNADFALIPITQSEYCDTFITDTSRAEIGVLFSGYNARIDSIGINYQVTAQPLVYEKESGWGWNYTLAFYAGYGAALVNGQIVLAPEIGVGFSIGIGYQRKFKRRNIINFSPNELVEKNARLINKKSKDEITDNQTNKL